MSVANEFIDRKKFNKNNFKNRYGKRNGSL